MTVRLLVTLERISKTDRAGATRRGVGSACAEEPAQRAVAREQAPQAQAGPTPMDRRCRRREYLRCALAFFGTLALALALGACSAMVEDALSDKPSSAAAAGGSGGTTASGGGGTDPGPAMHCGDGLLCIQGQHCCVSASEPSQVHCADACADDELPLYCGEAGDCPANRVCCAQYTLTVPPELLYAACVVTCDPLEGGVLVCTDQPSLCSAPLSCKPSVQLPAGMLICNL